jgi:hypothetical protein
MPESQGVLAEREDLKNADAHFQPPKEWVAMIEYHKKRL